jgi:cytochrome c biogenesis protein CcmG/thiol:disulfide interchange protein DsbE
VTRGRVAGLAAVLLLLVAGLAYGARDRPAPAPSTGELVGLRAAAALAPCPAGIGAGLPDVVLPCVGQPGDVRLSAPGTGRPTVVNIWATWCGPCVREIPVLQGLSERAAGKVDVVGVLHQDTRENALRFADDSSLGFDMTYPSVWDDTGTVLRAFGSGPPVTLLVARDGTVAHVRRGELSGAAELDALVAEHLGVRL